MAKSPYVILKWVLIALALLVVVYVGGLLAAKGYLLAVILTGMVGMAILLIYGMQRRLIPMKYLFPGLLLMVGLQIWPAVFTASTAFTNWGDGHTMSKEESIKAITGSSVEEVQGKPRYKLTVAVKEGQTPGAPSDPVYLLTDPMTNQTYAGTATGLGDALPAGDVTVNDAGKVTAAKGFTILNARQVNSWQELNDFSVPVDEATGAAIKKVGLSEAYEGAPTVRYDAAKDQIIDTRPAAAGQAEKVYGPVNASWVNVADPADRLPQGWKENVGLKNFSNAISDPTLRGGFLKILAWNIIFPILTVIGTFIIGLALALLFNDPRMKGKGFMRAILILPYALPGFVTALVWASMFNQQFGLINNVTGLGIDWLGNGMWAKVAIVLTNLWLGFPYMFIVCTGALQAIPMDVKEAAAIDGATGFRTVRSIIMPLVMVAVGPLLIASFAFNFNNFSLIFLMTEGGPFEGGQSAIGSTDLLITYAYRLAFTSAAPNYGYAAAISIFIFILVAAISWVGFRQTKALEEVN